MLSSNQDEPAWDNKFISLMETVGYEIWDTYFAKNLMFISFYHLSKISQILRLLSFQLFSIKQNLFEISNKCYPYTFNVGIKKS